MRDLPVCARAPSHTRDSPAAVAARAHPCSCPRVHGRHGILRSVTQRERKLTGQAVCAESVQHKPELLVIQTSIAAELKHRRPQCCAQHHMQCCVPVRRGGRRERMNGKAVAQAEIDDGKTHLQMITALSNARISASSWLARSCTSSTSGLRPFPVRRTGSTSSMRAEAYIPDTFEEVSEFDRTPPNRLVRLDRLLVLLLLLEVLLRIVHIPVALRTV
ncbi:hypothetical protein A0H81_10983 [Grifola frondosa]|uniref:Uncharacterized protein n=1 Tax=Grifola frondosa TaxID=5627 RepID=A0A1C7LXA1_GRIFR|nr:hypothetical protein A0H81_10983 [Grifola frondosa]